MKKRMVTLALAVLMMCSLLQNVNLTASAECVPPTDWSEDYPTGVPTNQIESKTEYRYRDKQTDSGSSVPAGWTQTGSSYQWGSWKDGAASGDDDARTLYYYFY